jgi:hypothetical protein
MRALMRTAATLLAVALVAGCSHKIGDACNVNVDCSPLGDRFCDTASPGGYCTIEGCDVRMDDNGNLIDSCPSEAVCVRFFSPIACRPCDPAVERDATAEHRCATDEVCVCDFADPAHPGACLPKTLPEMTADGTDGGCPEPQGLFGHCAPASSERRWCQYICGKDGDCRSGYQCRQTGTRGAEPVPRFETDGGVPFGDTASFCAPSGQPM